MKLNVEKCIWVNAFDMFLGPVRSVVKRNFHPDFLGEMIPILTSLFFSNGLILFNHQLVFYLFAVFWFWVSKNKTGEKMSQRTEFKVDRDWTGFGPALSLKQDSGKWQQQACPRNWPSNPHQAMQASQDVRILLKKYRPKPCKTIHVWNRKPIQPPRIPVRVKKWH